MKFYQLKIEIRPGQKIYPSAYLSPEMQGAEFMANSSKIKDPYKFDWSQVIDGINFKENVPVFDYFVLKELYGSSRKKFDWIKLDIYRFVGEHSNIGGSFLVSKKFREVISDFRLPKHKFYPAKLMYKGEKFDYYVFQLGEIFKPIYEQCTYQIKNFDPTDCRFKDTGIIMSANELNVKNKEDYYDLRIKYDKQDQRIDIEDCVFVEYFDYFNSREIHKVVSEPLKKAFEAANLTEGISLIDMSPHTITFLNQ